MNRNALSDPYPLALRRPGLSASSLKILAAVLMVLDHIHQMFAAAGAPVELTMAGRVVFPLFLFACAESFYHTRSKKQYLKRLLFASWGMTIFTFLLQRAFPNDSVVLMNNAFSTFFVAGVYMLCWDRLREGVKKNAPKQVVQALLCCLIPVLCALPIYLVAVLSADPAIPGSVIRLLAAASLLFPNPLIIEGGAAMAALGVAFYILREHRGLQITALVLLSVLVYLLGGGFQCLMGLAALPIALYNGERGRSRKAFFYAFYPAHIGALYLLSCLLL